jgi:hypothetical protein
MGIQDMCEVAKTCILVFPRIKTTILQSRNPRYMLQISVHSTMFKHSFHLLINLRTTDRRLNLTRSNVKLDAIEFKGV